MTGPIIIILPRMKIHRSFNKHFPTDRVPSAHNNPDNFYVKCLGEAWLQVHNKNELHDIVALPSEVKMASLETLTSFDECDEAAELELCFRCEDSVKIVSACCIGTETSIKMVKQYDNSQIGTVVSLGQSKYANLSLNPDKESFLNVFNATKNDENVESLFPIFNHQVQCDSLAYSQTAFYFLTDKPEQRLISFDVETETMEQKSQLPEFLQQNVQNRCFLLEAASNKKPDLACVYNRNWLGIVDMRMNNLVCSEQLFQCSDAFAFKGLKIGLSEGSNILEFDLRAGKIKRIPVLQHNQIIERCQQINESLYYVIDNMSSALHLYCPQQ